MKRITLAIIAALGLGTIGSAANAATVEIQWQNPEQYRDIRATNEGQKRFQERTMEELAEAFSEGAAALDSNMTLHLTVTDVDLAGEIEWFHDNYPFGLRVIRRVDSPRLTLNYELRDANGAVVQSASDVKVQDLGLNFKTDALTTRRFDAPYHYERRLIHDWMRDTFTLASS